MFGGQPVQPPGAVRLSVFEVDQAPAAPGIYAWYIAAPLSANDWKPDMAGASDRTVDHFLGALMRYGGYFGPESLSLTARANYASRWSGQLRGPDMRHEMATESTETTRLREAASDPAMRRVMVSLLGSAVPHFVAPAYIGVAVDLRARLAQHKADYEKGAAALRKAPDSAAELQRRGPSLGTRLAGAGIPLEYLSVAVLPVALPNTDVETARRAAEVTEWYLQRVFQPAFGRR